MVIRVELNGDGNHVYRREGENESLCLGAVIAEQIENPTYNLDKVEWLYADPVTGSTTRTNMAGEDQLDRKEYEPLGQEVQPDEPPVDPVDIGPTYNTADEPEWLCDAKARIETRFFELPVQCQINIIDNLSNVRIEYKPKYITIALPINHETGHSNIAPTLTATNKPNTATTEGSVNPASVPNDSGIDFEQQEDDYGNVSFGAGAGVSVDVTNVSITLDVPNFRSAETGDIEMSNCEQKLADIFTGKDSGAGFVDVNDGDGYDPIAKSDNTYIPFGTKPPFKGNLGDTHNHIYNDPEGDIKKATNIYAPLGGKILDSGVDSSDTPQKYITVYYEKFGSEKDVVLQIFHVQNFNTKLIGKSTDDLLLGQMGGEGTYTYYINNKDVGYHIHINATKKWWKGDYVNVSSG